MSDNTFEAATVEEALAKAAEALGVDAGDLDHEVVETKQDFWGTGGDTVTIKASERVQAEPEPEPAEQPEAPAEEPAAEAEAAQPEAEEPAAIADEEKPEPAGEPEPAKEQEAAKAEDAETDRKAAPDPEEKQEKAPKQETGDSEGDVSAEDVETLLAQIFHDMEFACTIEVAPDEGGFLAKVAGDDQELLLEGSGRCLSALELIANNAFRHKLPRGSKVTVDSGEFRAKRDDELTDLAFQVAHSAKESGRTQETQPLNPYERRQVHLALAEDGDVTTRSRGTGFLKNVQVIPERGGRGGGDSRRSRR